jgi:excisionase family DNA binding protein
VAPPRLLTVDEVRAELHIGRTLAYQLVESGALPVARIGHALRVRRADLDAYVEANLSCPEAR